MNNKLHQAAFCRAPLREMPEATGFLQASGRKRFLRKITWNGLSRFSMIPRAVQGGVMSTNKKTIEKTEGSVALQLFAASVIYAVLLCISYLE
jgi:hypothetical protein